MMGTPTRAWRFVGTTHDEVRAGRDIDRVAHACGVDPDVLRHATPIVGEEGQIHLLGHEWHVESTRRQTRRWCPACLAEAPYHRTAWDIDAVTHCVDHRLPLASECPDCAKAVTWYHLDVARCGCGASLKAIACEAVPEESLAFDAWLARRLDGQAGGVGAIDAMRLRDAIALVERTGAHDLAPHASFADTWKAEGAHTVLDRGFRVLRDGLDGFRAFLDRLVAAGRAADHGPRQWGVSVAYGGFGTWLAANAEVEGYGDILAIAREHARANVTLKRGTLLFGEAVGQEAGLNLAEAADRCGIGLIRLSRILRAHGHMPKTRQQGTPVLLDPALVDSIADRLRNCVDANGLADILGIGAVLATKLIKAGLIVPFVEAGASRLGTYAIERSQADDLLAQLEARLGEPGEHPPVDLPTARPARLRHRRRCHPMGPRRRPARPRRRSRRRRPAPRPRYRPGRHGDQAAPQWPRHDPERRRQSHRREMGGDQAARRRGLSRGRAAHGRLGDRAGRRRGLHGGLREGRGRRRQAGHALEVAAAEAGRRAGDWAGRLPVGVLSR